MSKEPIELNINELEDILEKYLSADDSINFAIKIVGHPGIGKSSVVRQTARKKNYFFIDTRLAFKENIDLGGYPVPDHAQKKMVYFRPKFIPPETVPDGYDGILWFLDEANRAHPTVIQTLFQIITDHICGEHELPKNTAIVIAGNLGETDNTAITDFDDSALDGRLAIFHLKPSAEIWLDWTDTAEIHPSITRYISFFPEKLWDEVNINPNPRGWHQASQAIKLAYSIKTEEELTYFLKNNPESSLIKVLKSLIGEITAIDFVSQIINPREITTSQVLSGNPGCIEKLKSGKLPSEDILWSISGAIGTIRHLRITENEFSDSSMKMLGNLIRFIGYSRADSRMSFFYMLLKECGVFTLIPKAVSLVCDGDEKTELLQKFNDLIK